MLLLFDFLFLTLSWTLSSALIVKYEPPVVFSFPCNRYLTQEYQVPLDNNDTSKLSWNGVFYIDEQWQTSSNVKLDIVFDRSTVVEVNPRQVHIIDLDATQKSFRLTTVQPPRLIHKIQFKVTSTGDEGPFPSVLSMNVNGLVVCDNKGRKTNVDLIQELTADGPTAAGEAHRNQCGMRYPTLSTNTMDLIDWPWRISLFAKDETNEWSLVCGGTLIAPNRVLTAGGCVKDRNETELMVNIGSRNVTVTDFSIHEEYEAVSLKNDIAVVLIDSAEEKPFPICLYADWPTPISGDNNSTLGAVNRLKSHEQELHALRIEDAILCLESNRRDFGKYLSTKTLCTKSERTTESEFLPGDGLYERFYDEDRMLFAWKIRGIFLASFDKSSPFELFTDVSKYLTFIHSNFVAGKSPVI